MTKIELIEKVNEVSEHSKKDVERILEVTIAVIQNALKAGEKVSLTGLGTFHVVDKKARIGRNPKTGESVQVPAKKAAKFKAGKELKEMLEKNNPVLPS